MTEKHDYTVIRTSRKTLVMQIKDGKVIVRAPEWLPDSYIEDFVNRKKNWMEKTLKRQEEYREAAGEMKLTKEDVDALADEARRVLPERVAYYAEKMGVTYGRITIRCQRTRWGSCTSKGNLNFNCLLMLAPPEAQDTVVVHELCHRKVMGHSPAFYDEVHKAFPEYDKWYKWLRDNGERLLYMLP